MLMERDLVLQESIVSSVSMRMRRPVLSDLIMPAEPGEFYGYPSEFTPDRPVFALLKCKSNKNRPIEQLRTLGSEANVLFQFSDLTRPMAHSVKMGHVSGLLGDILSEDVFCETWLAPAGITAEEFFEIRARKDIERLVATCSAVCSGHNTCVELHLGAVIAVMTGGGKFGIFLVRELTPSLVGIEACHVLLRCI